MRTFKKTSQHAGIDSRVISQISRWEWTKGKGLVVVYLDGLSCKSEYTLKELLDPVRMPEGRIVEVK